MKNTINFENLNESERQKFARDYIVKHTFLIKSDLVSFVLDNNECDDVPFDFSDITNNECLYYVSCLSSYVTSDTIEENIDRLKNLAKKDQENSKEYEKDIINLQDSAISEPTYKEFLEYIIVDPATCDRLNSLNESVIIGHNIWCRVSENDDISKNESVQKIAYDYFFNN